MATLKCSKCGNGIHYHDEANGTQILFIYEEDWEKLLASDLVTSKYLMEAWVDHYYAWKCDKCDSLHFFKKDYVTVDSVYEKTDEIILQASGKKYMVFTDIVWDIITENRVTGKEIMEKIPGNMLGYAGINDEMAVFYSDRRDLTPKEYYKRIV